MPDLSPRELLQSHLPITGDFRPEYLEYYGLLPLEIVDGRLRVATGTLEPNAEALADLEASFGMPVDLFQVECTELADAIRRTFSAAESVVELVKDLDSAVQPVLLPLDEIADTRDLANQPPVIRYVNLLIREAHEARASDIHLEATREGLRVRLRVDGVLTDMPGPPKGLQAAVISRIKLLAELDIAQRMVPQDGRIRVRLESRELDIRVSTVPALHGESVVLRLLDQGGQPTDLESLGMPPGILEGFRRLCGKAHGIVLVTGPTGSGKTTTLYTALGLRPATEEKVITVEDPVEYHLPNVTQVPVHAAGGITFPMALRSLLRQDPDVLMVGEMRDGETAAIAVQAAMTGHLVFSTLHTNDALSALTRLVDLGVEPYMIAAAVEGVLAQRLVRRVCPECRERYKPDPGAASLLASGPIPLQGARSRFERGRGCAACRQTGYRGRTGIYELLIMTDALRQCLVGGLDLPAMRRIAADEGLIQLRVDGWHKVQGGITTVEEVLRVAGE